MTEQERRINSGMKRMYRIGSEKQRQEKKVSGLFMNRVVSV